MSPREFRELVWAKGHELFRDMPWRDDTDPYRVLVSEIMLQQTQVDRVRPKFIEFLQWFPDISSLAAASLADVLILWRGLGYNRRAKYLHAAAQMIIDDFEGVFPSSVKQLQRLPGVGVNTAGAIGAYSFNLPSLFIETNIRTVYLHHFFADKNEVSDHDIMLRLIETLDREHPREWYWALMDYGAWLKKQGHGPIRQSKHYKKQSPLKGSPREMRGKIIAALTAGALSDDDLRQRVNADQRFKLAVASLHHDELIVYKNNHWCLTGAHERS